MQTTVWNPEISDLRELAVAVMRPEANGVMSARTAARCLSGVAGLVARTHGVQTMQRAAGAIVRHGLAWQSSFGHLPSFPGDVNAASAVEMIAVVARGILPIAGVDNMRAALSFWACETDPTIWASVTGS